MPDGSKHTVIESGTEFDGSVVSECGITLSGVLKGTVDAPSLTVTPSGNVNGNVTVSHFRSEGEVSGEVEAEVVELSGRVSDETVIKAKEIEVRLNDPDSPVRVQFGTCEFHVGEPGQARKAAKPSQAEIKAPAEAPAAKEKDEFAAAVSDLIK